MTSLAKQQALFKGKMSHPAAPGTLDTSTVSHRSGFAVDVTLSWPSLSVHRPPFLQVDTDTSG